MKKFKIIEKGRLSCSEMEQLVGGEVCRNFNGCSLYDTLCNNEIKQVMTPDICDGMAAVTYCPQYGTECPLHRENGGGGGTCGGILGIVPEF